MTLLVWLFIILSILFVFLSLLRRKRFGLNAVQAVVFSLLFFIFDYVGAKILFFLQGNPFELSFGGFSCYGGVIFMPIFMFVAVKIAHLHYGAVMDMFAPCCAVCLGVIRINCYVQGCCGAVTVYTDNGGSFIPPVQLIEAGVLFLFFILLLIAEYKGCTYACGEQYPKLVIAYGFLRFVMEHYRDTWKHIFGMSEGQWFAICTAIVAGIILALLRAKNLRRSYEIP